MSHISFFVFPQGVQLIQMKVAPPTEKSGKETPIISFILLERYNAIKLVQMVHGSLATLSKVIRGTQLLNKDVQNLAAALLNQEVNYWHTVKILNFRKPKNFAVIYLKFKHRSQILGSFVKKIVME